MDSISMFCITKEVILMWPFGFYGGGFLLGASTGFIGLLGIIGIVLFAVFFDYIVPVLEFLGIVQFLQYLGIWNPGDIVRSLWMLFLYIVVISILLYILGAIFLVLILGYYFVRSKISDWFDQDTYPQPPHPQHKIPFVGDDKRYRH